MRAVQGENAYQEYLDLLGDTRFRTLRIHCIFFDNIQKLGFTTIPWREHGVRGLLNTLREQEITPHKLQSIRNTLRWFSAKFGLLDPDSMERLKAKRKTIQEGLVVQAPTKSPTSFERSCRGTGKGCSGGLCGSLWRRQALTQATHAQTGTCARWRDFRWHAVPVSMTFSIPVRIATG